MEDRGSRVCDPLSSIYHPRPSLLIVEFKLQPSTPEQIAKTNKRHFLDRQDVAFIVCHFAATTQHGNIGRDDDAWEPSFKGAGEILQL